MLEKTKPDDAMVLVNALYFKGDWQKPFKAEDTHEQPFNLLDGSQKQLPFMHQEAPFGYMQEDGVTGVRLPYGEGWLSLYAFMPDRWEGFVEGMTPERYQDWIASMAEQRIRLAMPKVKLDYQIELIELLEALGVKRAFQEGQADLSGLFTDSGPLFISRVVQKSFLEINEKGTEAAAATAVAVTERSAPIDQPPAVVLDRPFLLAIRDDRTGVTLFTGTVQEP